MNRKNRLSKFVCLILVSLLTLFGIGRVFSAIEMDSDIKCFFDPANGEINPFGTRAFITVTESEGNTSFKFEQFAQPVPDSSESARSITIEQTRELIFYSTDVETARELVRMNLDFYYALIGYEDKAGFSSYDEAMTCQ